MNEKKIERLPLPRQLRTDETMGQAIRARAELSHRSLQQEIRFLIECGLHHEAHCAGNGSMAAGRHTASPETFAEETAKHMPSPAVTVGHAARPKFPAVPALRSQRRVKFA